MAQALLTTESTVQVPVIIVTFGEGPNAYTFGLYQKKKGVQVTRNNKIYNATQVTYPNYIQSLSIKKVNGTVNTYTLNIDYPVTQNDDPDLITKVLSSISASRKIKFTYGDAMLPSFMYREEEAILQDATLNPSYDSNVISYTITAVSTSLDSASGNYTFQAHSNTKPSDVIKSVLYNESYGLTKIFYGMQDKQKVEQLGLIPGDDRAVNIEKQVNTTPLQYLSYLVSCMLNIKDSPNSYTKSTQYVMTVSDETSGILNGPYFKISKVISSAPQTTSIDYYSLDIGYPTKDYIMNFSLKDNQAYSILYDYSMNSDLRSDYIYRIDDEGNTQAIYSPSISNNPETLKTSEAEKSYWNSLTSFPVTASIQIKGLLRSVLLMSYVRVNYYYYGKKFSGASGLYIITEQQDDISTSGYTTTLSMTRVEGDDKYYN